MEDLKQFIPIKYIYNINSLICLIIGVILNIGVIWLVIKKTPKEMKVYAKIILQTSINDLILLIITHFVQPIIFVSDGITIVIENGIANNWETPWNIFIYNFWLFISIFVSYFLMLTIAASLEFILLLFFYWIGYPPLNAKIENKQILEILGGYNNTKMLLRPTLYGNKSDIRWIIWLFSFFVFGIFCYLIIWFCSLKIVQYIKKNLKQNSSCSRIIQLNNQMTLNMAIQASIPILDILVFLFVTFASIAGVTSNWFICLTMFMGPLINWVPVLNPLVTIITVAPYRRTIIRVRPICQHFII
ncbi:hypothetical protein Mgra_00004295 [Meloidogyne graminicola]|uniref:G_PROTEIN_RECEP_F1_2 domain-containing protein n=1 Tax=Meloidogyne graminicola TaxID=189291 RepID=A0A8S9ZSS4_9BILA|nr:hypothetical protein Mgra_00004295 [Meloidogyne graminicola]